jgi:RES domain-containing protein
MIIFRIAKEEYASALIASGKANRWNVNDQHVIYTGSSRALAALEWITKRNAINLDASFRIMVISVPDDEQLVTEYTVDDLPDDWRLRTAYPVLQRLGSAWYTTRRSLLLRVPSAIIPAEFNYVINTTHPDFHAHVKLLRVEDFPWEKQLER